MRIWNIAIMILLLFLSVILNGQDCPEQLIFYKTTGGNGICVEFDSDPGFGNIVQDGNILTRVGNSNVFSTNNGNCNGNSPPSSPQTFLIGTTMCSYDNSGILPVDLLSFNHKIENEKVFLTWTTLSELNNDYFSVERLSENKTFKELGKINGRGTSNQFNQYEFTDRNPLNGIAYYRLKQIDFDGKFSYSKLISVNLNREQDINQIFDQVQVNYKGSATFMLFDITGKLIIKTNFSDQLEFDASSFHSKGMFMGTLISKGDIVSQKLLVF